jgi:hypothetical protein
VKEKLKGKRAGSAYEAQFTADALIRGLNVLTPYGDFLAYDLLVENQHGRLIRVQVKGTAVKQRDKVNTYRIGAGRSSDRVKTGRTKTKLSTDDADILAAYVAPAKTWYHIPVEHLSSITVHLRPTEKSAAQYEIWKEAWNVYHAK